MPQWEIWQWLMLGMLALLLVLAAPALVASLRKRDDRSLEASLRALQASLCEDGLRQREELLRTLQTISDGLSGIVNRGAAQQVAQFEAMDARQARMYNFTQESMGKYELRMQAIDKTLEQELAKNETRIEKMRETIEKSITDMRQENEKKLDEMRKTVDEKLQDTLNKRLTQSFTQVSEQLEQVYKSLGEMHRLAEGVGDLKRVLSNVKRRGVWGEIQLETSWVKCSPPRNTHPTCRYARASQSAWSSRFACPVKTMKNQCICQSTANSRRRISRGLRRRAIRATRSRPMPRAPR